MKDTWFPGGRLLFWAPVAILLAAMATIQVWTARQESQTYDESNQLISGYTYLITGHFTVATEHPPLLKLLWAIPVALLHPTPPNSITAEAQHDFVYANRVPADTILMAARSGAIAISALLGFCIAFWAKRHFGAGVAWAAVFLYALDPNFLAHGRYVKNDVGAALAIFAGAMTWGDYLMGPTRKRLWLAGVVLGLALATKNSTIILIPLMALLFAIRRWQSPALGIAAAARAMFATGLIALVVLWTIYRFEVGWIHGLPVPAATYFRNLGNVGLRHTDASQLVGFLMGNQSAEGWWYMTPVAMAVKTPLAELAVFFLAFSMVPFRLRHLRPRDIGFRWFLFLAPAVCYFAASIFSPLNVGLRHVLPVYPFLFVLAPGMVFRTPVPKWRRAVAPLAALLLVFETASIHPHYLAFFNALAGGPIGGQQYLVDSNLDWGQDVKNLKAYLDQRHIPEVCLAYFGTADLDYYGVRHRDLRAIPDEEAARRLDCVAVVSVTLLVLHRRELAGIDELQPDARIGYSIYVYDLRKPIPR